VDVLIAQGTEAGGPHRHDRHHGPHPEIVGIAGDRPVLARRRHRLRQQMAAALALPARPGRLVRLCLAQQRRGRREPGHQGQVIAAGSSDTLRSPTRTGKPARQLRTGLAR